MKKWIMAMSSVALVAGLLVGCSSSGDQKMMGNSSSSDQKMMNGSSSTSQSMMGGSNSGTSK